MLIYINDQAKRVAARYEWQRRNFDRFPVVSTTPDGLDVRQTPWSGPQVKEPSGYMVAELPHSIRASQRGWQDWHNPDADWPDDAIEAVIADDLAEVEWVA